MAGPRKPKKPVEKVEHPIQLLKRVLKYMLKDYKWTCLIVLVCLAFSSVGMIYGMMFMQSLVDDFVIPMTKAQNPDFAPLAKAMTRVATVMFVSAFASYAYNRLMVNVSQGTMKKLRIELFEHMEDLPIRYFDSHTSGDIMSVYTNDVDTLRQLFGQTLTSLVSSVLQIIFTLAAMIIMSPTLTVLSVAMVGVTLFVSTRLARVSGKYFARQQKNLGEANGYVEEMMTGLKVVKVFVHEEKSKEEFGDINGRLFHSAKTANTVANIMGPINANLGNLSYVIIAIVGGYLALHGSHALTVGALISFLALNKSFNMPIDQVSQQMNAIMAALAGAERVFKVIDAEPETDEGYVELVNATEAEDGSLTECAERTGRWAWKHPHHDGTTTYEELKGEVVFDDVDFGYTDDKMVLHNIDMFAKPGQKIAFVGSTGAGKTTITNLINRFYDIQDGKIRYDGININKIKKADLRNSLGIVLQDTHLFTGTILENIRYGRLDATDEECKAAAVLANADEFISRLPDGYDTKLAHDGSNLSQGQRQLIAIARAAVADPPVLILDEATSSIDTRTEKLVQQGMDALMTNRTTFVIAHRLSTVQNSDCIMVLENGRIIERGNHDDLIAQKGRYYQLYTGNKPEEEIA